MINKIEAASKQLADFVEALQNKCLNVPYLTFLTDLKPETFFFIMAGLCCFVILLIVLLITLFMWRCKVMRTRKKLRMFFGITDYQDFKISKMKGTKDRYFRTENDNHLKLMLPYAEKNQDTSRKKKVRVTYPESVLWLCAGKNTYVLRTKDPLDMIFLVHNLRDSGVNVPPCSYELDKQDKQKKSRNSVGDIIQSIVDTMGGNNQKFVDLCKARLTENGYAIITADNAIGADFFAKRNNVLYAVKCFLTERTTLTGMEALQTFNQIVKKTYAHSCMFISTGKITFAAAQYASENGIVIYCNEDLVSLLDKTPKPLPGKEFLQWELTSSDIFQLLPEGVVLKK